MRIVSFCKIILRGYLKQAGVNRGIEQKEINCNFKRLNKNNKDTTEETRPTILSIHFTRLGYLSTMLFRPVNA